VLRYITQKHDEMVVTLTAINKESMEAARQLAAVVERNTDALKSNNNVLDRFREASAGCRVKFRG
jgi:hypothetical protein